MYIKYIILETEHKLGIALEEESKGQNERK